MPNDPEGFLSKGGNCRELVSYRKAEVIYDFTYHFCQKFLARGDRTIDQMVQAARSGKQNIVEGSRASVTSSEIELKLTNIARASLDELLEDYGDYLRVRNHSAWDKDSREALYVRRLGSRRNESFETYRRFFEDRPPETLANIAICLIHQANYLLDRQIRQLEKDFVTKGGIRERMSNARRGYRNNQHRSGS
ncbi:MAG TPA: four helix bundle suffix domain-containing protein [Chthoniobacterales bacterium]